MNRVFMGSVLMVRGTLNANVNQAGLDNTVIQKRMNAIQIHVIMVAYVKI